MIKIYSSIHPHKYSNKNIDNVITLSFLFSIDILTRRRFIHLAVYWAIVKIINEGSGIRMLWVDFYLESRRNHICRCCVVWMKHFYKRRVMEAFLVSFPLITRGILLPDFEVHSLVFFAINAMSSCNNPVRCNERSATHSSVVVHQKDLPWPRTLFGIITSYNTTSLDLWVSALS